MFNNLIDGNPFNNFGSGGVFRPSVRNEAQRGALVCIDPAGPGEMRPAQEIAIGTTIAIDIGATMVGVVQFRPKFVEIMVPLGAPEPELPKDLDLQTATRLSVLVQSYGGLRTWLATGKILLNSLSQACRLAFYRREASEGMVPVFALRGFSSVKTDFGTFFAPILELTGFIDRDPDLFGPRVVPPPPPILPSQPTPAQLPPPGAAETSANPPSADQQTSTTTKPANRKALEPKPAASGTTASKGPFETYRPIGGRTPY